MHDVKHKKVLHIFVFIIIVAYLHKFIAKFNLLKIKKISEVWKCMFYVTNVVY